MFSARANGRAGGKTNRGSMADRPRERSEAIQRARAPLGLLRCACNDEARRKRGREAKRCRGARMTSPDDYDSLKTRLIQIKPDLPKRLQQVAAFALENPQEMALNTGIAQDEFEHMLTLIQSFYPPGVGACDLRDCWTGFETSLRDHMDTEERTVFPVVAPAHRPEVEALRAEHRVIRDALAELGLAVELHTLRKAAVDKLIVFLNQHATRENLSLYEWLERASGPRAHRGLLAMFDRRNKAVSGPRAAEPAASR